MDAEFKKKFQYAVLYLFLGIAFYAGLMNLGAVIRFGEWALGIVMPVLVGFMIAVVLNAPMRGMAHLLTMLSRGMDKKWHKRLPQKLIDVLSLILTIVGTLLLAVLVFSVVVPQVVESVSGIADMTVKNYPRLLRLLRSYGVDTTNLDGLTQLLHLESLLPRLTDNASVIAGKAFSAASSVLSAVVNGFTGFVIAVYLLASKQNLARQCRKLLYAYLKEPHADAVCRVASLCNETFFRFISGQCLESCILGMIFFVTMTILHMPYTAVISVFIAFMALIPYIGAFLGMLVGFLLIVMVNPLQAFLFIGVFLIIQQVEGQFIYPRVVGSSVGLPAMWTMIAVLIGGAMFGLVGMVFFIPLTSVLYTLLRDHMNERLTQKKIDLAEKGIDDSQ